MCAGGHRPGPHPVRLLRLHRPQGRGVRDAVPDHQRRPAQPPLPGPRRHPRRRVCAASCADSSSNAAPKGRSDAPSAEDCRFRRVRSVVGYVSECAIRRRIRSRGGSGCFPPDIDCSSAPWPPSAAGRLAAAGADPPGADLFAPGDPTDEVLRRLNLRLAWRAFVPTDGSTGRPRPHRVGREGPVRPDAQRDRPAHGRRDRPGPLADDGRQALHDAARSSRSTAGRSTSSPTPSCTASTARTGQQEVGIRRSRRASPRRPVADEEQIYVPTVTTPGCPPTILPFVTERAPMRPAKVNRRSAPSTAAIRRPRPPAPPDLVGPDEHPTRLPAAANVRGRFRHQPIGQGARLRQDPPREGRPSTETLTRSAPRAGSACPPGSFGDTAYVGCDDAALYAINIDTGKLRWRHTAGTAITRSPVATAKDVFVTSDREGLARIDRETRRSRLAHPQRPILLDRQRRRPTASSRPTAASSTPPTTAAGCSSSTTSAASG